MQKKQKFEKERKAFTRQNDKNKDEKQLIDKLYKDIDIMKDEILHKEDRVNFNSFNFNHINR